MFILNLFGVFVVVFEASVFEKGMMWNHCFFLYLSSVVGIAFRRPSSSSNKVNQMLMTFLMISYLQNTDGAEAAGYHEAIF